MTREDAARLLGVAADASDDDVRRAWRMWARVAHPDAGGSGEHFAALDRARHVLLQAPPSAATPSPAEAGSDAWAVPERARLGSVIASPAHPRLLMLSAAAVVALAALPAVLGAAVGTVDFVLAAVPAAIAAALWAAAAARSMLSGTADRGHRIALLALAWLPIAVGQQVVSAVAGAGLMTVLPLMALPLAAVVGAINFGAGLLRPINAPRR